MTVTHLGDQAPKGKHVKSTDPIKKIVVGELKRSVGCTKVTLLTKLDDYTFTAHCMKPSGKGKGDWESLGFWELKYTKPGM